MAFSASNLSGAFNQKPKIKYTHKKGFRRQKGHLSLSIIIVQKIVLLQRHLKKTRQSRRYEENLDGKI